MRTVLLTAASAHNHQNREAMLVMYLHGGSSKGNDNETQMKEAAVNVIHKYLSDNSIPSIFIVPQCPSQESREQHQRPTSGQCESAL